MGERAKMANNNAKGVGNMAQINTKDDLLKRAGAVFGSSGRTGMTSGLRSLRESSENG